MALSNFGQQFATKTLRKFYQSAVTPVVTNSNYEGDIKKAGDRVNILSFLSDLTLEDYVAGTDMTVQSIVDFQDQLVVEKRKSYSFPIDRLEDLFTYGDDIADNLVENANKVLERTIDSYVLENAQYAKAGSWVGVDLLVYGNGADTCASIATSATGGTVYIQGAGTGGSPGMPENPRDGNTYFGGFDSTADIGKPIRLTSGSGWATGWYRITAVTNTLQATIENWDGATSGADIPTGDILRHLYGGNIDDESIFAQNGDGKPLTQANANGWGWEFQAAAGTAVSKSTIYNAITQVARRLDENEIPDTDRHIVVPPVATQMLRQASELQPAIAMAYEGVVINGTVGRVAGFDIHEAAGARVSTRASHGTATGQGADVALVTGATTYMVLGSHISYITFAYKWSESRIVDAENQFAKKYQGLHLFGAKVPNLRRKAGSTLFCTF